jgi:hypothetical protein
MARVPTYLDEDGLANYFPPRAGETRRGSDTLTAFLISAADEAAKLDPSMGLPDAVRAPMEHALVAFVEGKIARKFWSPREDLPMRKLAAIEALSRSGKAQARMLSSITIAPNQWPTHAVIDWLRILRSVPGIANQAARLQEAEQILHSRLNRTRAPLIFSTEQDDYWWWLMQNGDVNTARLMLAVMDDPAWKDDMGRLANGFISRQQARCLAHHHGQPVGRPGAGKIQRQVRGHAGVGHHQGHDVRQHVQRGLEQGRAREGQRHDRRRRTRATWFGAPASPGNLKNNDMFLPWGKAGGKEAWR